jgi:hypothetical protein
MTLTIVILILVLVIGLHTKGGNTNYTEEGRSWVCKLYYEQAHHTSYIRHLLDKNAAPFHYDEFDKGANAALLELERRERQ